VAFILKYKGLERRSFRIFLVFAGSAVACVGLQVMAFLITLTLCENMILISV